MNNSIIISKRKQKKKVICFSYLFQSNNNNKAKKKNCCHFYMLQSIQIKIAWFVQWLNFLCSILMYEWYVIENVTQKFGKKENVWLFWQFCYFVFFSVVQPKGQKEENEYCTLQAIKCANVRSFYVYTCIWILFSVSFVFFFRSFFLMQWTRLNCISSRYRNESVSNDN